MADPLGCRDRIAKLRTTRPASGIFWEFVEQERNNLLKVYEFGAQQHVTVYPGAA